MENPEPGTGGDLVPDAGGDPRPATSGPPNGDESPLSISGRIFSTLEHAWFQRVVGMAAVFFGFFDGRYFSIISLMLPLAIHRSKSLRGLGRGIQAVIYITTFSALFAMLWVGGEQWNRNRDNSPLIKAIAEAVGAKITTTIGKLTPSRSTTEPPLVAPAQPKPQIVPKPKDDLCVEDQVRPYKCKSNTELGQWAIDESERIQGLAAEGRFTREGTIEWRRSEFDKEFQHCCSSEIKGLRTELLKRLGPSGSSLEEEESWTMLFPGIKYPGASTEVTILGVGQYAPYLRRLGLRLKRLEIPRPPTMHLQFEELAITPAPLGSSAPNAIKVTLRTKKELTTGYIAVEFDQIPVSSSTDFQTTELITGDIENRALITMLSQERGRVYALRIAANPFVPEVPVHVFAESVKPIHVVGAFWFDE